MNVVLLGPQGSGKGTQAKLIARAYGIPHVATGDVVRELRSLDTEVGRAVRAVYDAGGLVDDELMIRIIRERLGRGDTLPGFVLDGFPRTLPQAEALDALLAELDRNLDVVLEFQVRDRQTLIDRMLKRAAEEHRSDDTPEAIERRLALYERETAPLVEYYRSTRGNVVGIHADRSVDEVFAEIRAALDEVAARAVGATGARRRAEAAGLPAEARDPA
jgi:adenylate kinase